MFMFKFFSSVLKQKKIIISLLLFFILAGIILPKTASAEFCLWFQDGCESYFTSLTKNIPNPVVNAIHTGINIITGFFLSIPLIFSAIFSFIAGTLLNVIIAFSIEGVRYTSTVFAENPAVSTGWPIVRNFANMLIVVALIVIALATILRFKNYEAKQLLAKLIIAALLINFSLVICGIVIDASNIIMKGFLKKPNTSVVDLTAVEKIPGLLSPVNGKDGKVESPPFYAARIFGNVFFNMMKGIVGFLYVFLFLFRIIALWILVILSPLALACYVLPYTKTMVFDKWLSNFLEWCFIGIFGALFLHIGNLTNDAMINLKDLKLSGNSYGLSSLFTFFVPGMFLVIGFIFSLQLSAMGAGLATSLGKKVGLAGAKITMDKSGMTRAKNWAQDKATSVGEKFGVVQQGTTLLNQKKRLAEAKQRNAVFADDPKKLKEIAEQKITRFSSQTAREDKAAAAEMLAGQKKFGMIDKDKQEEIAAHAVAYGTKKSTITDAHPELLTEVTDKQAKQQLIAKEKATWVESNMASGMSKEAAEKKAQKDVKLYKPSEMDIKIEKQAMRDEKIKERTLGYQPVTDDEAKNKVINDKIESQKASWESGIKSMNPGIKDDEVKIRLKEKAEEMRKEYQKTAYSPSTPEILKAKKELMEERGTPEAAGINETEIGKLLATNPSMTRQAAQQRLINNAYASYKVNTEDATDTEVIDEIKKGKAKGAKFLKEALKRDILHTIDATDREVALINANKYGERTEEFENKDYRYGAYNTKRLDRLEKADPGKKRADYQKMAIAERLNEAMPRMFHDQLRNIDKDDIISPKAYESMKKMSSESIKAFETAEPQLRAAVRSHIMQLRVDGTAAKAAAAATTDKNEKNVQNRKYNELKRVWLAIKKVKP